MDKGIRMQIKVTVNDNKEQLAIANAIHEQLVGNSDYINDRILLSIDVNGETNLYFFDDMEGDIPTIVI